MKPFLKWAGGKTQLLPELRKYLPPEFNRYYEPFVGAGAVLFELQPYTAVINDVNAELINCYNMIKWFLKMLVMELSGYKNDEDFYYSVRALDRVRNNFKPDVESAARTIYLNKTCFNGLYRVNSKGQFNTPYGRYKNEFKPDEETILAVSKYLNESQVTILSGDFETTVKDAREGDFVYFDPPYDPVSETANFTAYNSGGFSRGDQARL